MARASTPESRAKEWNKQGMHAVSTATVEYWHVRRELMLMEFSGGQPDSFRTG
jgi:hypothetical protein